MKPTDTRQQPQPYAFSLELPVRDYELDSEGIVNNAVYLHYLEHTRHAFVKQAGIPFADMTASGMVPVVRRIEADYLTPLRSGDVMVSSLWIERQGARFIFHQHIRNQATGAMAVQAVVTIVCLENGRPSRGDALAQAFAPYLTTQQPQP